MNKFRWGGIDKVTSPDDIYLDETIRRMVATHRSAMLDLATALYNEGVEADISADDYEGEIKEELLKYAKERYVKSLAVVDTMVTKLPTVAAPYSVQIGEIIGDIYLRLGQALNDETVSQKGLDLLESEIRRYAQYIRYFQSLKPWQYQSLQRTDRYIAGNYFMSLLQAYNHGGGDTEELMLELENQGVNFGQFLRE
jgi:hypothetical protein